MIERKHKIFTLFGENVILSERDAYDVMAMVNFSLQTKTQLTPEIFLYQSAKVVESGLKYSYKNLRWYQILKKLKLIRLLNVKYLLRHLSQSEIFRLANQVYELEGISVEREASQKKKRSQNLPSP